MTRADQLTDPVAHHGEGPVWWPAWGGLRWVDMLAGDVLALAADGTITRRHVANVAAAIRPRANGGMVIAVERGFALDDGSGAPPRRLAELWSDPGVRMNDGGCDPQGRFYGGSMSPDQPSRRGALYRLDADGSTQLLLTGVGISNGLDWSPDGSTAYYVDTATQRIDAFDHDPQAGLVNRRTLVTIDAQHGSPDGLTVDAEGGIWTALWGGGAVHRYRPDGVLDLVVEVPVRQVSACTFGGEHLDELFITTSREGLGDSAEPAAGSLFHYRGAVVGQRTRPFAG